MDRQGLADGPGRERVSGGARPLSQHGLPSERGHAAARLPSSVHFRRDNRAVVLLLNFGGWKQTSSPQRHRSTSHHHRPRLPAAGRRPRRAPRAPALVRRAESPTPPTPPNVLRTRQHTRAQSDCAPPSVEQKDLVESSDLCQSLRQHSAVCCSCLFANMQLREGSLSEHKLREVHLGSAYTWCTGLPGS